MSTGETDTIDNKHRNIKHTDVTIHGSHSDVIQTYAAPPVKQYPDYRSAVKYGTGHETAMKTVTPRNLQTSAYQRTDKGSRPNKVMHGNGSGTYRCCWITSYQLMKTLHHPTISKKLNIYSKKLVQSLFTHKLFQL